MVPGLSKFTREPRPWVTYPALETLSDGVTFARFVNEECCFTAIVSRSSTSIVHSSLNFLLGMGGEIVKYWDYPVTRCIYRIFGLVFRVGLWSRCRPKKEDW